MNWNSLLISFLIGVAIDVALVWMFYRWNGEPFQWAGFWIWQAVLLGAGALLWLRKLIGYFVWYALLGREAIASEAFQTYVEYEFAPFSDSWGDVLVWIEEHQPDGRQSAATQLGVAALMTRQAGLCQFWMIKSAYKKAAKRYSRYLNRRQPH